MTWFLVTWITWSCPGGLLSGLVPAAARPLVCAPEVKREPYDKLARAQDRVRAIGPGAAASIDQVRGLRLKSQDVTWTQTVNFGG